jgi:hypothetical protein
MPLLCPSRTVCQNRTGTSVPAFRPACGVAPCMYDGSGLLKRSSVNVLICSPIGVSPYPSLTASFTVSLTLIYWKETLHSCSVQQVISTFPLHVPRIPTNPLDLIIYPQLFPFLSYLTIRKRPSKIARSRSHLLSTDATPPRIALLPPGAPQLSSPLIRLP